MERVIQNLSSCTLSYTSCLEISSNFLLASYSVADDFSPLSKISDSGDVKCTYWHVYVQIPLKRQHYPLG